MSGVEGWIDWHGGENPVPGLVVQVQWRDQSARYTPDDESCSDEWKWGHHDMYCDIIAYRVVTPAALSAIEGGGFGSSSPKSEDTHRVPEGWVLVPKEPTEAMLRGACDKHTPGEPMSEHRGECPRFEARRRIWERMIEASATAPASDTTAGYEPEASEPKDAARRDEEAGR